MTRKGGKGNLVHRLQYPWCLCLMMPRANSAADSLDCREKVLQSKGVELPEDKRCCGVYPCPTLLPLKKGLSAETQRHTLLARYAFNKNNTVLPFSPCTCSYATQPFARSQSLPKVLQQGARRAASVWRSHGLSTLTSISCPQGSEKNP